MSCDFRLITHNYIAQENVALIPSTEDSEFPASNIRHPFRSKVWRTTDTVGSLVIDLRTEELIDTFMMYFDPVLKNRFSTLAIFRLQASATLNWASTPVDVTMTMDEVNEILSHYFETGVEYRYWKFSVDDEFNPDGFLEIPKLWLGRRLDIVRLPSIGFKLEMNDPSIKDRTIFGHEYADILPIRKTLSFNLPFLDEADSEELVKAYHRTGSVKPVMVVIDSQETLFAKNRFTIYGKFQSTMEQGHQFRDFFEITVSIEETF